MTVEVLSFHGRGRRFSPWGWGIGFGLALALGWLALVSLPMEMTFPGAVDPSWKAVLAYAASQHWHWGSEIVFTFGPLGYLYLPLYTREHWVTCLAFSSLDALFYLWVLTRVAAGLPTIQGRRAFCLLGIVMASISSDAMFLLSLAFTGLLLCGEDRRDFRLGGLGIVIAALASFIKLTFLVHACFMLWCFALHCLLQGRWQRAAYGLLGYLVLSLIVWGVLCDQPMSLLPVYIRNSLEITSSYSEAMGRSPYPYLVLAGFACLCVTSGTLLAAWLRDKSWRNIAPTLLLLGTLFLGWKQGFTRGDMVHMPAFFAVAMPILAWAWISFRPQDSRYLEKRDLILVLTLAIVVCGPLWDRQSLPKSIGDKVEWLAQAAFGGKELERKAQEASEWFVLPKIKKAVGEHSIDVIGCEQGFAILNGLNYRPAPVFQSYAAATAALIKLNTEYYQSKSAPDFIMLEMKTIDDHRYPTLDCSRTLLEIPQRYEPVLAERGFLLLQRRAAPLAPGVMTLSASGEMVGGENIPLPPGLVWCEIDLQETLVGRLVRFFLHTPVITLETRPTGAGAVIGWRLIPANARAGFLISPLMQSNGDFLGLWEGNSGDVASLTTRPDRLLSWVFKPKINYRIYNLGVFPIAPGQQSLPRLQAIHRELEEEEAKAHQTYR